MRNGRRKSPGLITKTILSCLFVFVAILQPPTVPSYGKFILIGLIFAWREISVWPCQGTRYFGRDWLPFWRATSFM